MFPCHTDDVLQDLVTETVVQVSQPYASYEVVLAVSQSGYLPERLFQLWKTIMYKNIFFNTFLWQKNTTQQVFVRENFESIKAMKNSFEEIEGKVNKILMLWIAKLLLLSVLKGPEDHSER